MTLKKLALATALVTAPFMAQAELQSMDDASLSSVTGQAGISISGDFSGSIGNVAYVYDGNKLNMEGISMTGFAISDTDPLKIDVIDDAGTAKIAISLPAMTGTVAVNAIKVGGTYTSGSGVTGGTNIGGVAISDINMSGTTVKIWGH